MPNFNYSCRDKSFVVVVKNRVKKPKCYELTSLIKNLSNFSKALTVQIFFTAVMTNGGIGKGIEKNDIYVS